MPVCDPARSLGSLVSSHQRDRLLERSDPDLRTLQVDQDRCRNCNECAISVRCPTQAFDRLPKEQPYRLKATAMTVLRQNAKHPRHPRARGLLEHVFDK